ncbi:MAG TPA: flavoprotein [Mycobacteriales bacterium]|nr:flavoprotein [Mycobacteriales bacterium]
MLELATGVQAAGSLGFETYLVLTPSARLWVDVPRLTELTGHPVQWEYRLPGTSPVAPPADAVLVAPATFNTVNKLAAGLTDNLALGIVSEAVGNCTPTVCVPFTNKPLSAHFAFSASLRRLSENGMEILMDGRVVSPTQPDSGFDMVNLFPWDDALRRLLGRLAGQPAAPSDTGQ